MVGHCPDNLIEIPEAIGGEGFLSPGGPDEVARIIDGLNLRGRGVLDIGCGAGGVDLSLVRTHGAGCVTGIDLEDGGLERARELVSKAGLSDRIGLAGAWPGPLPFPPRREKRSWRATSASGKG